MFIQAISLRCDVCDGTCTARKNIESGEVYDVQVTVSRCITPETCPGKITEALQHPKEPT